jgi:hypothetical protein
MTNETVSAAILLSIVFLPTLLLSVRVAVDRAEWSEASRKQHAPEARTQWHGWQFWPGELARAQIV